MKSLLAAFVLLPGAPAIAEDLSLPFDGRWFVLQAGDTLNVNHHTSLRSQLYGIDFVKASGASGRELTRGQPTSIEDFYSWGENVRAPAARVVTSVVADLPDNPLGTKDPKNAAGNHVVIQIAEGQFVFIAHLQQGSATVAKGDKVRRDQLLGLCGNSGNSDYPHVHLHIQDDPSFGHGTGQNPVFGPIDVELTGRQFEGVTWPLIRGLFVSNAGNPAGHDPKPR